MCFTTPISLKSLVKAKRGVPRGSVGQGQNAYDAVRRARRHRDPKRDARAEAIHLGQRSAFPGRFLGELGDACDELEPRRSFREDCIRVRVCDFGHLTNLSSKGTGGVASRDAKRRARAAQVLLRL